MKKDMFEDCSVDCPYTKECTSYPIKCGICGHNKRKNDHFEPRHPPIKPWPIWFNDKGWTVSFEYKQ